MTTNYEPTIGLEIHAELKTKTKMFCCSKNDADATDPNVNICPVCMAHPGTLPVINGEAVRLVLRVGLALGADLADYTEFDRKNYFYPDLPKGYQLSQYEYPLVSGGVLNDVAITRVHLEEDTASSMHAEGVGTTIDYNRAGVPLMELVTEPVIKSSKQAGDFARELQLLLRTLGASDANMEKGQMRVEANVSIAPKATPSSAKESPFGTKVEIKNLNSFRAMERAVEYEIKRQEAVLEKGEPVVQETRGWDEGKQATFPQRVKEGDADYRYFPDPDLPSLKLSEVAELSKESLRVNMPELPWERRDRYLALGVKGDDAQLYVQEPILGGFFEEVIALARADKERVVVASNYIANDLVKLIRDVEERDTGYQSKIGISAQNFIKIIDMVAGKKISSRTAKDLLVETTKSGRDPEEVAKSGNLYQVSAGVDFEAVVTDVISENSAVVDDFKAGKAAALEHLVGQCMKALKGAGNPVVLRELIRKKIA
ncbi:glutaminyl-tRNA synthase (glutamine-hydrolyzing) subunit B [Candidatus Kaiserbacteria bacterium RIFCSPHIGHO2_02_FULL_55_20]|uniref:Aspartyl/glutamyl-tRNA(Asn/Gln) amidotransferase subunit B n=1 Tax=Candidatus Kaiserbacteria bacterium RIFCSPHIGHO2_02_FULL_55_20 TaxID=1798497 RepID=A0A1F6DXV0_9BACT|nr:MAG: glutaminyl-tRNA synthase (glutamine-hydrolyzing) subunit B [Candidatus Kaiserbacteria bacterium RIFCSPHIGHO2_01_FULL_55_37]OGG66253.1 MAG: glutaminyl-tRNA synthase (glutamine-hydrolyzing) subunit B [Candidatus Kaiserbacteria bacterium RIFCSPHIGHO2_02_FULL_55_20]